MADIRIKDLATLESASLTGDVFVIDGTTGTRKLSAFSPSFGGNATVTGTLTANGLLTAAATTSLDGLPTAAIFGATKRVAIGYNTSGDYGFIASADSGTTWKELHLNPSGGLVKVPSTSASTSTSSGALVVSGGVGVAGNIWTGGQVNLAATSVEASTGINFGVALAASRDIVFFGDGTRGGMLRGYHDGSNIARLGFGYWASSGDTYTSVIDITGSATTSSQLVAIAGTAGSTSTTSGALTVAGGMGVAEAVNAGTFFGLVDGVTAPATGSGYARIYVDSADGDLKVKFGDGTVKTIATDS